MHAHDARPPGELRLRCGCGQLRARAVEVSPSSSNRCVCYCRDCRAFARWLGRTDVLDAGGGHDVIQLARARVIFDAGIEQLACMRLSEKGLFRWYAACCKTPVGNTMAAVPFIGVSHAFFDPGEAAEMARRVPGAVPVHTKSAIGPVARGNASEVRMYGRMARLILQWTLQRLGGETFFDPRTKAPRVTPRVLTPDERAALSD